MRYSNAFSSLNSLKNSLTSTSAKSLCSVDNNIILDAIEIAIDNSERSFEKALMYAFYNTGNTIESSALELSEAFAEAINNNILTNQELTSVRILLNSSQLSFENVSPELVKKIDSIMRILTINKMESTSDNSPLRKQYSY